MLLDEGVFEEEGLAFRLGDDEVEVVDLLDESLGLAAEFGFVRKVGAESVAEAYRFADVEYLSALAAHRVDAGLSRGTAARRSAKSSAREGDSVVSEVDMGCVS